MIRAYSDMHLPLRLHTMLDRFQALIKNYTLEPAQTRRMIPEAWEDKVPVVGAVQAPKHYDSIPHQPSSAYQGLFVGPCRLSQAV